MAGEPDINEKLLRGHRAAGKTFRVHIDGYNLLPYLTGDAPKSPRQGFLYFSDDGDLVALRFDNWKPKLFNLRTDPFERADVTSNTYYDWFLDHDYIVLCAQVVVTEFLATFKEFPRRQRAASFTIDQAIEKMQVAATVGAH